MTTSPAAQTVETPVLNRRRPPRAIVVALLTVAMALGLVGPAAARTLSPDLESQLVRMTNQARAAHGLAPLTVEPQLTRIARDWSDTMASRKELSHRPKLADAIEGDWRRIGENVGVGPRLETVQQAFMDSAGHRKNILGDYDRVGIGVYEQDGRLWITVNFLEGRGDFPVFNDVQANTHRANIEQLFTRGTTLGCTFDRFCPGSTVTRGQMATFLVRELGLTARDGGFGDVPRGHVHAGAIGALAAAGITTGCSEGRFCPDERVNRGQMATFLSRAKQLTPTTPRGLSDVPASNVHAGTIGALQQAGISQGCTTSRYCPSDGVTRGQMATFLQRAFG